MDIILTLCDEFKLKNWQVENVVKPPQKPIVQNRARELPSSDVRPNIPDTKPIRKHPARFTISVPHGKPLLRLPIATEIKYRAPPPKKLPKPTISKFLKISTLIF